MDSGPTEKYCIRAEKMDFVVFLQVINGIQVKKEEQIMSGFKVLGEFYFSKLLGTSIYDKSGQRIGKIKDMAVRWEGAYPHIIGIKHTKKIHELIPIDQIEIFNYTISCTKLQSIPLNIKRMNLARIEQYVIATTDK